MSSGGGCTRFKQNAWKKDLCSNCYRPKEEHQESPRQPLPALPLLPPSQGILVSLSKKEKVKKKSVSFTQEESEIIGYGGADSSEEEDDYEYIETREEEREVAGEEERELETLTKNNTEYNTNVGNLTGGGGGALPLGKEPQKQKLQVTIQPFNMANLGVRRKAHLNKLLEEDTAEPVVKSIVIETGAAHKEEPRGSPEGRKTQITRGSVITKSHEQVKNKLYIQTTLANKTKVEHKLKDENENKKTENTELNRTIIITGVSGVEERNARNLAVPPRSPKEEDEVRVKVLKIVGDGLAESREMAGEPDGKADSDEADTETPSSLSPPPRASFLHREVSQPLPLSHTLSSSPASPPVPPILIPCNDARSPSSSVPTTPTTPPPAVPTTPPPSSPPLPPLPVSTPPLPAIAVPSLPATTPPPSTPPLPATPPPPSSSPLPPLPTTSPPPTPPPFVEAVRSSSKRPAPKPPAPEPCPRRRGSLGEGATDSKKKTRVRQTLRKLLRFGSREEEPRSPDGEGPPRPRPHIIHPLDLNKSAVQVLPPTLSDKSTAEIYSSNTSLSNYSIGRPCKPPPPPRSESLNLMERLRPSPTSENNVYANLGEGRCGITPVKPQRTGSLRDTTKQVTIQTDTDNLYECVGVSSAPECDMSLPPYYGSETESDIYYPYVTFQNGECKTKMSKRDRATVHTTLEENYGAVVLANHEALTHLLQKIVARKPEIPKEILLEELRWSSFDIVEDQEMLKVGSFSFLQAKLNGIPLTLSVTGQDLLIPDIMEPWAQFKCTPPSKYIVHNERNNVTVTVMKNTKIESLITYTKHLEKNADSVKEAVGVLLQAIKQLTNTKGTVDRNNFIVFYQQNTPSVSYLPTEKKEDGESVEKCVGWLSWALIGSLPLSGVVERCSDLPEMCHLLETWLWGPAPALPTSGVSKWLDLHRADALHSVVCSTGLWDPHHLAFLVHATPKSVATATRLIQQSNCY